ncbi:MAG: hypothetical protein ACR2NZ_15930 [Rubripirellula sp.]
MSNVIAQLTRLVAGAFVVATFVSGSQAADPADYLGYKSNHRILSSDLPPGVLGQARLAGRGCVAGYYQPIAFMGPEGARFALPQGGSFADTKEVLNAGVLVGSVYRFQVTRIPGAEGAELYPTIEVIDRTYPPPGLATRYPIVIQLDQDDFDAAMAGQLVTRVVYLEDPDTATPIEQTPITNRPVEAAEYQDALEVADRLGRPVAIVRIGSVAPPRSLALLPQFFFGNPIWAPIHEPEIATPLPVVAPARPTLLPSTTVTDSSVSDLGGPSATVTDLDSTVTDLDSTVTDLDSTVTDLDSTVTDQQ